MKTILVVPGVTSVSDVNERFGFVTIWRNLREQYHPMEQAGVDRAARKKENPRTAPSESTRRANAERAASTLLLRARDGGTGNSSSSRVARQLKGTASPHRLVLSLHQTIQSACLIGLLHAQPLIDFSDSALQSPGSSEIPDRG